MGHINMFELGKVVTTTAVRETEHQDDLLWALSRHQSGDWGEVSEDDKRCNDDSVDGRGRLLSAFTLLSGNKVWCLTEWDRSCTTILYPSEW
jgi:hypothetical protein